MEKGKARQTSLFEEYPKVAELPESQRQKALLLLGSLLTEALAKHGEYEGGEPSREVSRDKNHC